MYKVLNSLDRNVLKTNAPELKMLQQNGLNHLEAAEAIWNNFASDDGVNNFSGIDNNKVPKELWNSILIEWHSFLCTDDDKYEVIKSEIEKVKDNATVTIVALITGKIAEIVSIPIAILTPIISIFLLSFISSTKRLACKKLSDSIKRMTDE